MSFPSPSAHLPARHGFGLLETFLAMFAMALSISAAVILYGESGATERAQAFQVELMDVMAVSTRMTQSVATATYTTLDIMNTRQLAARYVSDNNIVGPSNEVVFATGAVGTTGNGTGVVHTISIVNLSAHDCALLGTWGSGNGIQTMSIKTRAGALTYNWDTGKTMDPASVGPVCARQDGGTATFTY